MGNGNGHTTVLVHPIKQGSVKMDFSLGDIAQWLTLLGGVGLFLYRQSKSDGERLAKWEDFQKAVISRLENLETTAYSRGGEGFVTVRDYEERLNRCGDKHSMKIDSFQETTNLKIAQLETMFQSVSTKLEAMDTARESTRERDQKRLSNIETMLATLTSEVKHLTAITPTLQELVTALKQSNQSK